MGKNPKPEPCLFQRENVICTAPRRCEDCGWNPKVEVERNRKLRQEFENREDKK